jgi:acetylornithine deacetylase/succinyl-diaminopimelate desuccinylase-like protein
VNATIIRASDKINVVPSTIELELDTRALPGFTPEQVMGEVRDLIGADVELELVRHDPGPPAPDLTLYDMLGGVLRELDPEGIPVPFMQPGVTDARFFAPLGIQTYGFVPLRLSPDFDFLSVVHAADERVPVSALEFGAEAIFRALQRF